MITRYIGNKLIGMGRKIARKEGKTEMAVELSDHSIHVRMVDVESDKFAWDHNLYRYGNLFLRGYANPIKPYVNHHKELEDHDTVGLQDSEGNLSDGGNEELEDTENKPEVMSSNRYVSYMKQELIESLLNPRQQWKLVAYAVIGLAVLMAINIVITLSAAGAF